MLTVQRKPNIVSELEKIFANRAKDCVMSSKEDLYSYTYDNNCKVTEQETPIAVVLPEKTEDVQKVVRLCSKYNTPIIPRGAGTNHVGGCVAKNGGIIIHFSKMNKIIDISKENLTALVQPGVVIGDLQDAVASIGLFYPPDPSNLRVSTIGGALALSSGGPRALKYGTAKDYVLNLKVVLPDGSLMTTGSDCSKNVAGINLTQLFIGSEGTLGIIVEATLKLIPKPETSNIMLAYFNSIEEASAGVNTILEAGIVPAVIDLLDNFTIQTIEDYMPAGLLTDKPAMLFIELDGYSEAVQQQEEAIKQLLSRAKIQSVCDKTQANIYWTSRRAAFAATCKLKGNVITEDVAVPRVQIPALVSGIKAINEKFNLTACIMGHAGDGNIHPNYALDFDDTEEMFRFYKAKDELFSLAIKLGGTVSGEHGIGFEKIKYLKKSLDTNAVKLSGKIKAVFDPQNIMNPGKIF